MKRGILNLAWIMICISMVGVVSAQEDIQQAPACKFCGMDRAKFAHTRMRVTYDDGTTVGTCSIRCLSIDLALNIDKTPRTLQVGDFKSKMLIDAEKAFWVIGGNKPGVMTAQAKWAFEMKEDAERFIMENGGALATFDEAMKATYESLYADTRMIWDKRKMMKSKATGHQ